MGILESSGGLPQTSSPSTNHNLLGGGKEVLDSEDVVASSTHIQNTIHNKTVLNNGRSKRTLDLLSGFVDGHGIMVTYFQYLDSTASVKSSLSSLSFSANTANFAFRKIYNFEIKLEGPIDFNYDSAEGKATSSGVALFYNGLTPRNGELFLYEVEAGVLGIYKITAAGSRLAIAGTTHHTAPFTLVGIASSEQLMELEDRTRQSAYFNKTRFLLNDGALLTATEYRETIWVAEQYKELYGYFMSTYYNTSDYSSVTRPDDIFDPYVAKFLSDEIIKLPNYPSNIEILVEPLLHYHNSPWGRLVDNNSLNWLGMSLNYTVSTYDMELSSSRLNGLINKEYITLTDVALPVEGELPYMSDSFGNIDTSTYNVFDNLYIFYAEYGYIDITALRALMDNIYTLGKSVEQFYQIPVLLFMLIKLSDMLFEGKESNILDAPTSPYRHIEFTQPSDAMVLDILTVLSPGAKAIGLISDTGAQVYIEVSDITYTPTGFNLDLTSTKAELAIVGDLPGTWKVIIMNNNLM